MAKADAGRLEQLLLICPGMASSSVGVQVLCPFRLFLMPAACSCTSLLTRTHSMGTSHATHLGVNSSSFERLHSACYPLPDHVTDRWSSNSCLSSQRSLSIFFSVSNLMASVDRWTCSHLIDTSYCHGTFTFSAPEAVRLEASGTVGASKIF